MSSKFYDRHFSVSGLKEVVQFDRHWTRSFVNGRAIYVAKKNNASLTLYRKVKNSLSPIIIQRFKKGSRVVVDDAAFHVPPHTTEVL
ncbi:hypothetical protein SY83_09795 [Paenibacillus swuensis]|uniref:Transposase n=1 Tax=Paenibacillus swuensis TaxID=1178515 RepID=A0A172TIA9_9BACL|nr:hypothetical protein [Paenibacillus swuensis]ANE46523.1 hypothetical protein SY83_09795 [Paenibacillus swuensis]